jgi:hypothetical protein
MEYGIDLNLVADKFPKEVFDYDALHKIYGDAVKEK